MSIPAPVLLSNQRAVVFGQCVDTVFWTFPTDALLTIAGHQLCLFAAHLQMVQNFHQLSLFPWLHLAGVGATAERQSVIEIERDGKVGIDLKFGSITFKEEDKGTFAVALIDVVVGDKARRPLVSRWR